MLDIAKDKMENKRKGFFIEDILLNLKENANDEENGTEISKTLSGALGLKLSSSQSDLFNVQHENEPQLGESTFTKYHLQDKYPSTSESDEYNKQTKDRASCSQLKELTTHNSWTMPTNYLPVTPQVHNLHQTNFIPHPSTGQHLASLLQYNPAGQQLQQLSQLVNKHNHRHLTPSHLSHFHQSHYPHTPKTRKRDKKMRRPRTNFSDQQLRELEGLFTKQKYLNVQERTELAEKLGLNEMQIKTWYQNRRTKWKRQTQLSLDMLSQSMHQQRNVYQNTEELYQTNQGPNNATTPFPLIKPSPISLVNVLSSDQATATPSTVNSNFSSVLNFGTDRLHIQSALLFGNRATTL